MSKIFNMAIVIECVGVDISECSQVNNNGTDPGQYAALKSYRREACYDTAYCPTSY